MSNFTLKDIQRLEAEEADNFKKAVEDWRTMKANGEGDAVIVEAGGGFTSEIQEGAPAPPNNASAGNVDDESGDDDDDDNKASIDLSALEGSLSPETLAALRSHVSEQASSPQLVDTNSPPEMVLPVENFGMSQFWWDDESAERLGEELIKVAQESRLATAIAVAETSSNGGGGSDWQESSKQPLRLAILSAPSVWFGIHRLLAAKEPAIRAEFEVTLFEFDHRFASSAGASFTFFDYNELSDLPAEMAGSFDGMLAGPPYVSATCIDKYIEAFDVLARSTASPRSIVIGATLEEALAERGYDMADDMVLSYQSKFCTPMKLFRKYNAVSKS
mmetsp:Transcript_89310/g.172994  ORF Transcript_89310/g.172994 Transcript_89310/m.172994 type:complete len:332 (+) Transcript_89310:14-1009(+)